MKAYSSVVQLFSCSVLWAVSTPLYCVLQTLIRFQISDSKPERLLFTFFLLGEVISTFQVETHEHFPGLSGSDIHILWMFYWNETLSQTMCLKNPETNVELNIRPLAAAVKSKIQVAF